MAQKEKNFYEILCFSKVHILSSYILKRILKRLFIVNTFISNAPEKYKNTQGTKFDLILFNFQTYFFNEIFQSVTHNGVFMVVIARQISTDKRCSWSVRSKNVARKYHYFLYGVDGCRATYVGLQISSDLTKKFFLPARL